MQRIKVLISCAQLCSYCTADLRLCFRLCKLLVFPCFHLAQFAIFPLPLVCFVEIIQKLIRNFSYTASYISFTGEDKIIRECESNLMKSAYHRLRMPVLRRHGYCLKARHNDFWNPRQMEDPNMEYCFCNDWNGCNSATAMYSRLLLPLFSIFSLLAYSLKHYVL